MDNLIQMPPQPTSTETHPDVLHQNAHNYLNSPEGQLQDVRNSMVSASKRGDFSLDTRNLSKTTVKTLTDEGHDITQNAGGGYTINWNKKMLKKNP